VKLELKEPYKKLVTIPGIGKILGLTIMLETGPVQMGNFQQVEEFLDFIDMAGTGRCGSGCWLDTGETGGMPASPDVTLLLFQGRGTAATTRGGGSCFHCGLLAFRFFARLLNVLRHLDHLLPFYKCPG